MGNYMNVVANNIPGMYTQRQLGIVNTNKSKSAEKLSSGYRINRAADDAAGLTISENMRRMIRGLTQASLNVEDGVSLCQVADGYLDEVHDMLHRLTELSVKGSNGTLTDDDRAAIDEEVTALKKEMRRIFNVANFNEIPLFHVPYTPEIMGEPNDIGLFHVGNGNIGGLEFNNVRYNIAELQDKGLMIDANGVATEDFQASFELYDGETVDISMKKGDSLASAKRNYNWKAKDDGIYINNKLSAEWNEVVGPDGNTLPAGIETFSPGTYSFRHRGMTISFEIDEESSIDQVFNGINGDLATQPATWDVSVGGEESKATVTIDNNDPQPIYVNNANKGFIDHTFAVVADEKGIAIKDKTAKYTTDYQAWGTFKDNFKTNISDENGNKIDTNGGYPIKNWGTENDSNSESEITFDDSARYLYYANDNNVPTFAFAFKLADSASLEEVSKSFSYNMSSSKVYARGSFSIGGSNTNGNLSVVSNSRSFVNAGVDDNTGDFALQRAYGRDFGDDLNTNKLSANISVTRTAIGTDPSTDTPDGTGAYSVSGHTVYDRVLNDPGTAVVSSPYDETVTYYYNESEGTYHKYTSYKEDRVSTEKYTVKDKWIWNVEYTFNGTLNGNDMDSVTKPQTETWERQLTQTRTATVVAQTTNKNLGVVSEDDLTDEEKATAIHVATRTGLPEHNYTLSTPVYSDYITTKTGTASLVGVGTGNYSMDFTSDKGKAFTFNYRVNTDQAKSLATGAATKTVGTITFNASEPAYRLFMPYTYGTISEATYSKIDLNVPKKKLNIQAGADKGNTITMEWNALNLTILGLSNANTKTQESAQNMIGMVQGALDIISETRSTFGAYQNRFEHTIRNLDNVVENTQAAESIIRDTDMAKEMVNYSKQSILEQAGTAILTQSNQSKQWIISLLNQ